MRIHVAVLTAIVLLAIPGAALTAFPGENGRIAFDSDRDGSDDIWTMEPDGSELRNLTADSTGDDFGAAWSPDGKRVAFTRDTDGLEGPDDFEIWLMRADGSGQTQLTNNTEYDLEPSWSPSGRRIVFQRDPDGDEADDGEIWVMRADGSGERQLTDNAVEDNEPAWSPDGRRIAFHRDADPAPDATNIDVFDMRRDGRGVRQLTDEPGFDGGPNYSPDGRKIAFDSERDGDADVWVMRRNGADPTQLTGEDQAEDAVEILTAFSPDGQFISFSSTRDSMDPNIFEVYVMRADGSEETNRTNNPANDINPDWQPLDDDDDDDDDEDNDD